MKRQRQRGTEPGQGVACRLCRGSQVCAGLRDWGSSDRARISPQQSQSTNWHLCDMAIYRDQELEGKYLFTV